MSVREIVICPEMGLMTATALIVCLLGFIISKMIVIPSGWGLMITILGSIVLAIGLFDLRRNSDSIKSDGIGSK
jgi:hypothetical protein